MARQSLGKGFFPYTDSDKLLYFDKNKFLTLGNGDSLLSLTGDEDIIDGDETVSKFFAILTTLIFYTDPSESNIVWLDMLDVDYVQKLEELFPDYIFYRSVDKEIISEMNPVIICDSILDRDYEELNPYLVMGDFLPEENIYFYDGIILRPIYGTKTRLIVKGISYRTWDNKNLCRMLNHHTHIVRKNYHFFDPVDGSRKNMEEADYDRTAARYILAAYLKKVNIDQGNIDVVQEIISI